MPSAIAYEFARLSTEIERLEADKAQLEAGNDQLRDLLAAKHERFVAREAFAVVSGP